jgi:hypothetical protein
MLDVILITLSVILAAVMTWQLEKDYNRIRGPDRSKWRRPE